MITKIELDVASERIFTNKLQSKQRSTINASVTAVHAAASLVFDLAQATIPVQTGALQASGKITIDVQGDTASAIISYGDNTVNPDTGETTAQYALERHEDITFGEGYKWLEKAMLESSDKVVSTLANVLRRTL